MGVPVRDAATVMLVRDAPPDRASGDPGGLEVFMLRRNLRSDFVGGAYVFPGGGVDDHDRFADLESVCQGRRDADASEQLGRGRRRPGLLGGRHPRVLRGGRRAAGL